MIDPIEAQVGVEDISDVHPDTRAEVHLTAYKQPIIPIIHGDVIQVSAGRLTDPKSSAPHYTAFVRIDRDELAAMPNVRLCPGMPATIPTVQRTAFEYNVGPLVIIQSVIPIEVGAAFIAATLPTARNHRLQIILRLLLCLALMCGNADARLDALRGIRER
ncbi:hypothetical protein I3J27_13990 [Bradyrhizobium xenonodulans]|uniref:AprE-like beta-barrel domain-containing protein n=1 Tax=Bradyrhizobium xenonodulans TaxID=2736875 RepID=A0ABY7MST9_9BRAD|nr:hypothetical protein [Bradyrhizobium xenonodulans]WBL81471.1 hypothetical protein I3J27_13990 [Bradyrhizobium xenonodulans]